MKNRDIDRVLRLLENERGLDFSGSSRSVVENGIERRVRQTGVGTCSGYYDFISSNPEEYDRLVQALTVNVSCFFRNPLVFEYLSEIIFPGILARKSEIEDMEVRVWSAGCASGEEPYSIAICIRELSGRTTCGFDFYVFGTDIDSETLVLADKGIFLKQGIENVRYGYLKYFDQERDRFRLKDEIRKMVSFSSHDLLDGKDRVPSDCVFADFDIVFCRNVLIYFTRQLQEKALSKIYRSLGIGGYLVLGEAEVPPEKYRKCFEKVDFCQIYRKIR